MSKLTSTCELREKDVINVCDGARLGNAGDFEIDICDGRICSLIVCRETGFMGFGNGEKIIIPWEKIECIGEDAVLVKVPPSELCIFENRKNKKEKNR